MIEEKSINSMKLKMHYFSKAGIKIHLKYPLDTTKKKFYQLGRSVSPN